MTNIETLTSRYVCEEFLNRGMKGEVFKVYDKEDGSYKAMKITGDDGFNYDFYLEIGLDSFFKVHEVYYVAKDKEKLSHHFPGIMWESLDMYDELLIYTMDIYYPVRWKEVTSEQVHKILIDFAIFYQEYNLFWEDFNCNIMRKKNGDLVFIDIDDFDEGYGVKASDKMLEFFDSFMVKYKNVSENLGVPADKWVF